MKASKAASFGVLTLLVSSLLVIDAVSASAEESGSTKTIPVYTFTPDGPAGTYWSLQHVIDGPAYPPLPMSPFPGLEVEVLDATNGIFLIHDELVDWIGLEAELRDSPLIEQAFMQGLGLQVMEWESGGGYGMSFSYSSDDLWLEVLSVTNTPNGQTAWLVVHPPDAESADGVYDLYSTTNFNLTVAPALGATNWQWVLRTEPGQMTLVLTNLTAEQNYFILGRTNDEDADALSHAFERLVSHSNPTNSDTDGDGMLDGFEWNHFGSFSFTSGDDYDSDGISNGSEFTNHTDPNTIAFWMTVPSAYIRTNAFSVQFTVTKGVPSGIAVLVNDTNLASAAWQPYTSSNLLVALGSTDGEYEVRIGLRGWRETSEQTWRKMIITRDTVPPALFITAPLAATNSQSLIQLRGYASEPLSTIYFDRTNASGLITNQPGFVTLQDYNTNTFRFTTNYFQCYDIFLTNGVNTVTVRVSDLAGNASVTNRSFTLTSDAIEPAIQLTWPLNGTKISGDDFTLTGAMDDPSATVTATLVTNGVTNVLSGIVGRSGGFRIENVPLIAGTNQLQLTATDAWDNSSTTNIAVVQSAATLTIDPLTTEQLLEFTATVTGTVSDTNLDVWVGGIQATVNEDGTWYADNVPVNHDGRNVILVTAVPIGSNPNTTPGSAEIQFGQATPPVVMVVGLNLSETRISHINIGASSNHRTVTSNKQGSWIEFAGGSYSDHLHTVFTISGSLVDDCTISALLPSLPWNGTTPLDANDSCHGPTAIFFPLASQHVARQEPELTSYLDAHIALKTGGDDTPGPMDHYRIKYLVYDGILLLHPSRVRIPGSTLTISSEDPNAVEIQVSAPHGASHGLIVPQVPDEPAVAAASSTDVLKLSITANGVTLDPDVVVSNADFIVGQMITFSTNRNFALQGVQSRTMQWAFEGTYFNDQTNAVAGGSMPNSSDVPFRNLNLLKQESTTNWWISGGTNPPAVYTVRLTNVLTLQNGLHVTNLSRGLFRMLRPQTTITTTTGIVALDINMTRSEDCVSIFGLHYGIPSGCGGTPGISFTNFTRVPEGFSGNGKWVQIVTDFKIRYQTNDASGAWIQKHATNVVDDPYPYYSDPVRTEDSPGANIDPPYCHSKRLTDSRSFEMWFEFQPTNGPSGSIDGQWVPLGKVGWSCSGEALLVVTNCASTSWAGTNFIINFDPPNIGPDQYPWWWNKVTNIQYVPE